MAVVAGFKGQAWLARKSEKAGVSMAASEAALERALPFQRVASLPGPISTKPAWLSVPVNNLPVATPYVLSADTTTLVAAMCDLQLLAHDSNLTLTSQQWSGFASVVVQAQAMRQVYEAQIATAREVSPGQYRVEIPAYPAAGDLLREQFYAELRAELGPIAAAKVLAGLGERLEARFAGFGVSVQTLEITADPDGAPNDVQVTRTANYWNSVEGDDRVTTRREMHFPALEDPTGDRWSALLAMVKS